VWRHIRCHIWHQETAGRIEEDVRPVTYMKTRAVELLRSVDENRRPVIITKSGEPRGVLMDFASYQELRRATLLRLIAQGEADVRKGRTAPQAEVFADVRFPTGEFRSAAIVFGTRREDQGVVRTAYSPRREAPHAP
jgi:prevent-host-death family protein